jgi:hypothetical protein
VRVTGVLALAALAVALAAPVAARADGTPPPPPPPPPTSANGKITLSAPSAGRVRAGRLITISAKATSAGAAVDSGSLSCTARASRQRVVVVSASLKSGVAACVLRVPRGTAGKRLVGSLSVSTADASGSRSFALPIGH